MSVCGGVRVRGAEETRDKGRVLTKDVRIRRIGEVGKLIDLGQEALTKSLVDDQADGEELF